MYLFVLLLFVLILILILFCYGWKEKEKPKKKEIQTRFPLIEKHLRHRLNMTLEHSGYSKPFYNLRVYEYSLSYTNNKRDIVIGRNGKSMNYLLKIALHEMAHVLCPSESEEHSDEYMKIEEDLVYVAYRLGYYKQIEGE